MNKRGDAVLEALMVSIDEQIRAHSAGGAHPSVSRAAKDAGISRQAVYAGYPTVAARVSEVRQKAAARNVQSVTSHNLALRRSLQAERAKVRMLTTAVVELAAELKMVRTEAGERIALLERRLEAKIGGY